MIPLVLFFAFTKVEMTVLAGHLRSVPYLLQLISHILYMGHTGLSKVFTIPGKSWNLHSWLYILAQVIFIALTTPSPSLPIEIKLILYTY